MNKLLIVLLAVCLVSTHAFVKRDASTPAEELQAQLAVAKKNFEELFNKLSAEASKNLDPEAVKKNFNDLVDVVNNAVSKLKPAEEVKPAA